MLRFNIEYILNARGFKQGYTYLKQNGFSQSTATKYCRSEMTVLRLADVEKICELFHCTPNELLDWQPNKDTKDIENHPLFPLKRKEVMVKVSEAMSTLKIEELEKVNKFISDLKGKKE